MMKQQEIQDTFQGGFVIGSSLTAVELLLNDEVTTDNILKLLAYDANLMPMRDFSNWSDDAKEELTDRMLEKLEDFNIEVWIDDVKIKERSDAK